MNVGPNKTLKLYKNTGTWLLRVVISIVNLCTKKQIYLAWINNCIRQHFAGCNDFRFAHASSIHHWGFRTLRSTPNTTLQWFYMSVMVSHKASNSTAFSIAFSDWQQRNIKGLHYGSPQRPAIMMTSANGNIFHVTGHLGVEFTGHRWIPRTKASDADLWCFLWFAPE